MTINSFTSRLISLLWVHHHQHRGWRGMTAV